MESSARTWIAALAADSGPPPDRLAHSRAAAYLFLRRRLDDRWGAGAHRRPGGDRAACAGRRAVRPRAVGLDGSGYPAVWNARDPGQQAVECLVSDRDTALSSRSPTKLAGFRLTSSAPIVAAGLVWPPLSEHALHSWAIRGQPRPGHSPCGARSAARRRVLQVAACGGKPPGVPYRVGIQTTDLERQFPAHVAVRTDSRGARRSRPHTSPALRMPGRGAPRLV